MWVVEIPITCFWFTWLAFLLLYAVKNTTGVMVAIPSEVGRTFDSMLLESLRLGSIAQTKRYTI